MNNFKHLHSTIQEKMKDEYIKEKRLKTITPFVIDNSIRETTVGQTRGHTVQDKWKILEQVCRCGFRDIIVASFSTTPQVDDEFVRQLVAKETDLSPYYAFSELMHSEDDDELPVGLSKVIHHGLHNIIFELDLAVPDYDAKRLKKVLKNRLQTTKEQVPGRLVKAFLNLRDFGIAMEKVPDRLFSIVRFISLLGPLRPRGLLFEEAIGIHSSTKVGVWTEVVRMLMNENGWKHGLLLVHAHERWSMAHNVQLESLASGADGLWAGVCDEGAAYGHAGSAITLMNLVHIGNENVRKKYNCTALREVAASISLVTTGTPPHPYHPIYGARAIDQVFDLTGIAGGIRGESSLDVPAFFGVDTPLRITTSASPEMIQSKLINVFGSNSFFTLQVAKRMKETIVKSLIEGHKHEYMTPMGLAVLFGKSGGNITKNMVAVVEHYPVKVERHVLLLEEIRRQWDSWDEPREENEIAEDYMSFESFYKCFMFRHFDDYMTKRAQKTLRIIDMNNDGFVNWNQLLLYLKFALAQKPDLPNPMDVVDFAFSFGIIPVMYASSDTKLNFNFKMKLKFTTRKLSNLVNLNLIK